MENYLRNLITVDENHLLVWDTDTGEIVAHRLDDGQDQTNRQVIKLTERPYFTVTDLKISPNRALLAICGTKGVTIMRIPHKRSNAYENGKPIIFCDTWNINERSFRCQRRLKINQVEWHPFSCDRSQVLCILSNDNHLRLYDVISDSWSELQDINLNKCVSPEDLNLTSMSMNQSAHNQSTATVYGINDESDDDNGDDLCAHISMMDLGESAVAFDFGPPVLAQTEHTIPVYLVKGTGEVLLVYICLENPYYSRKVTGPLKMLPQAEDNYGSDACSLVIIDSSPPMLAIGTSTGAIHHCFAIIDNDESTSNGADGVSSNQNSLGYGIDLLPRQTLYMYETLELNINLTESSDDPYVTCQMRLHKDKTSNLRYFCTHPNGAHLVTVPVIQAFDSLDMLQANVDSFSEFLICTRPISSSSNESVSVPKGFAIAIRVAYIALITLLSNNEVISRRLRPTSALIQTKSKTSRGIISAEDSERELDLIKEASREDFDEQLQRILRREVSLPMIKCDDKDQDRPECVRSLMESSIATLRIEYIKRFDAASKALKKKIELLKHDSGCQLDQMAYCLEEKEKVLRSLELLSGNVDVACKRQENLLARIDKTLETMLMQQPELSEAEAKLKIDLHGMYDKVKFYRDQLESLKDKHHFQREQLEASNMGFSPKQSVSQDILPSSRQMLGIKEILSKQSAEIAELKKLVSSHSTSKHFI